MNNINKLLANREASLGNECYNDGKYQDALDHYEKSLNHTPTFTVFVNCIRVEEYVGDLQNALKMAASAIRCFPEYADSYILQGILYKKTKQYVPAVSDFKRGDSLTNDPNDEYLISMKLGECYLRLNKYDSATDSFENAVKNNGNSVKAQLLLGNSFMNIADYKDANNAFTAAISINPKIPVLYYNRAHCMILYKEWTKERNQVIAPNINARISRTINQDLKTAVSLNPHFQKYVNKLQSKVGGGNSHAIELKPGEDPVKELDQMIGLTTVKREIRQYIFGAKLKRKSGSANGKRETMNLVFEGNPGTGKTQVANLVPKILYKEGLLQKPIFVKIRGSRLLSSYYGESARNMDNAIHNALGGVLFIDEAYDLMPRRSDDEGKKSIITELLQGAENYRGRLIIILAGYPKQMEDFLSNSNPGMRSRFNHIITFPDYNAVELYKIFLLQVLHSNNIVKSTDLVYVRKNIRTALMLMNAKGRPTGNGRLPRELLDFMNEAKRTRLAGKYDVNYIASHPTLYYTFTHQDIVIGFQSYYKNERIDPKKELEQIKELKAKNVKEAKLKKAKRIKKSLIKPHENAYAELQHMIGLTSVKSKINSFIANLKAAKFFGGHDDVDLGNMNIIFEGGPGTGKTQVARLMAKIMYQKKIIKKPKLIECSAKDLVGRYIGETGPKTAKVIKSALGGVLFIDEAYELDSGNNSFNTGNADYNGEAIATLIQLMENHRHDLLVIMAGYKDRMENFLNTTNPGLNSRFPNKVLFPDYTDKEMCQIVMLQAKNPKYHCIFNDESKADVLTHMTEYINFVRNSHISFGNGRDARVILQAIVQARNSRIINKLAMYANDKKKAEIITPDDVNKGFKNVESSKRLER